MTSKKSTKQIDKWPRQTHVVDIGDVATGIIDADGNAVTKASVRILLAGTLEGAQIDAANYIARRSPTDKAAKDIFFQNADVLENSVAVEVLWNAFRVHGDETWPLFESAEWMRKNLTAQAIGQLANIYQGCEARELPTPWPELTPERVRETVALCHANLDNAFPEMLLEPYVLAANGRRYLLQFIALASVQWTDDLAVCRAALEAAARGEDAGNLVADALDRIGRSGPDA